MNDWASGYNVDVGYTFGFYKEMSPNWLNCVSTLRGLSAPSGSALRYLELGCGYGYGLILLAAAHPEYEFFGIDFNPTHIAHGRKLARDAGLKNIQFEEADFVELAENWPKEWGQYDYVVAHGIYTWVDTPVRDALIKTIKNATNPGALVYLSYNTMPGWASGLPVQHLLRLWQRTEQLDSVTAINEGIKRLKDLVNANSVMTQVLPSQKKRVDAMEGKDIHYLIHEYLNDGWRPVWFNEVADALSDAKLNYVATASIGDLFVDTFLPQGMKDILAQYTDTVTRQVMFDVLVNQNFRKDVFTRGAGKLWDAERQRAILDLALVALYQPENGIYKFTLATGEAQGKTEIYHAYFDALLSGPKTIEELVSIVGRPLNEAIATITMLVHGGYLGLYKPIENSCGAKSLNRVIFENVANGVPYSFLIAAETGVVFKVTEYSLIMAYEIISDSSLKEPSELAARLVKRLEVLGKTLSQNDQVVQSHGERLQTATALAETFLNKTWGTWQKLGVI